jgi:hypothetical protein
MVVFLKTSEEAKCDPKTNCEYTWTSTLPELTRVDLHWDETDYEWQIRATGTNFTGDENSVDLYIANTK